VRTEVIESYFFLSAVRRILVSLAQVKRRENHPPKEVVVAAKAFAGAVPSAVVLNRVLEREFVIRRTDLPEFGDMSAGGLAFKTARGQDYLMAGAVSLEGTMAALEKLSPVLAAHQVPSG
jgi:hypothetical protein